MRIKDQVKVTNILASDACEIPNEIVLELEGDDDVESEIKSLLEDKLEVDVESFNYQFVN